VSRKEDTFFKERGHDSREKKSVNFWPKYFSVAGGCTVWVCTFRMDLGTEIEGIFGTIFEAISIFFVVVSGPYEIVRTGDCGHKKRGTKEVGQRYGFGIENEANFCGTDLVL
jgi:hypothetical protein